MKSTIKILFDEHVYPETAQKLAREREQILTDTSLEGLPVNSTPIATENKELLKFPIIEHTESKANSNKSSTDNSGYEIPHEIFKTSQRNFTVPRYESSLENSPENSPKNSINNKTSLKNIKMNCYLAYSIKTSFSNKGNEDL